MHLWHQDSLKVSDNILKVYKLYKGVASLTPARSHTLLEIDHEIISTVFKKGCCQLQAKECARSTG